MPTEPSPYIPQNPGDLLTAEAWNAMQQKIREDIAKQIQEAIKKVQTVPKAGDAQKLGGKTTDELTKDILDKALAEIPTRTGYQMIFKRLKKDEDKVIEHGLKCSPLVDVYQLDYFPVVCSEDDQKSKMFVNFYLYHSSEKKLRLENETFVIEPAQGPPYRIALEIMLHRFEVKYTLGTSLGDLETELWKKVFASQNDEFDDDQYCHSPWFDRCCREETTVGELQNKGPWNDLWFQMRPRKTINYPYGPAGATPAANPEGSAAQPAPTQVQVVHFDFDTLGARLLSDPVYPDGLPAEINKQELKVMLLLKV